MSNLALLWQKYKLCSHISCRRKGAIDGMNSNKKKTPIFCTFKYWDDRHEPRGMWGNWRLLLDMIDDAERVPKLAVESLASNFGSVPYQILNFIKVVEPCITCGFGLTICPHI